MQISAIDSPAYTHRTPPHTLFNHSTLKMCAWRGLNLNLQMHRTPPAVQCNGNLQQKLRRGVLTKLSTYLRPACVVFCVQFFLFCGPTISRVVPTQQSKVAHGLNTHDSIRLPFSEALIFFYVLSCVYPQECNNMLRLVGLLNAREMPNTKTHQLVCNVVAMHLLRNFSSWERFLRRLVVPCTRNTKPEGWLVQSMQNLLCTTCCQQTLILTGDVPRGMEVWKISCFIKHWDYINKMLSPLVQQLLPEGSSFISGTVGVSSTSQTHCHHTIFTYVQ